MVPSFVGRYSLASPLSAFSSTGSPAAGDPHDADVEVQRQAQRERCHGPRQQIDPFAIESITITKKQENDGRWIRIKETMMQNGTQFLEKRVVAPLQHAFREHTNAGSMKPMQQTPSSPSLSLPSHTRRTTSYEAVSTCDDANSAFAAILPSSASTMTVAAKAADQAPHHSQQESSLISATPTRTKSIAGRINSALGDENEEDMTSIIIPLGELSHTRDQRSGGRTTKTTRRIAFTMTSFLLFMFVASRSISSEPQPAAAVAASATTVETRMISESVPSDALLPSVESTSTMMADGDE